MSGGIRLIVLGLGAAAVAGLASGTAAGQDTGAIVGWGQRVVVPQSVLTDLVAVAAGGGHSLVLQRYEGSTNATVMIKIPVG